jgi:hypothetical protein
VKKISLYVDTLDSHGFTQKLLHTSLNIQIEILPQFLAIETRLVRKAAIALLAQFLAMESRKGCGGQIKIAILTLFLTIAPHFISYEMVVRDKLQS